MLTEKFFERSSDIFAILSLEGQFLHCNMAWKEILGYDPEDLYQYKFMELVHPDDVEQTLEERKVIHQGIGTKKIDVRIRCKDGSYRCIRWTSSVDLEEKSVYAVGRDVTVEVQNHKRLVQEKNRLRDLLAQLPAIAAVVRGPEHVCEYANPYLIALLGGRDPIGKPMREVLPGIETTTISILDEVYKTGQRHIAVNFPVTADWRSDGHFSERFFNYIYEPMTDLDGNVEGIWGITFDVTEYILSERKLRASERMASLGQMAASVAHEINNPLTYSWISTEFILEKLKALNQTGDKKFDEIFELISRSLSGLERVRDIVSSLKVFSRIDEAENSSLDLQLAINTAVAMTSVQLKHCTRVIEDYKPLPSIKGNLGKLSQVFVNLLLNASQAFTSEDPDKNWIRVKAYGNANNEVVVEVEDNGCGIAPENLGRIFEPFFTTKDLHAGTGLGLSVCQGIIQAAGGDIHVTSEVNKGTLVRVTLPAEIALTSQPQNSTTH